MHSFKDKCILAILLKHVYIFMFAIRLHSFRLRLLSKVEKTSYEIIWSRWNFLALFFFLCTENEIRLISFNLPLLFNKPLPFSRSFRQNASMQKYVKIDLELGLHLTTWNLLQFCRKLHYRKETASRFWENERCK